MVSQEGSHHLETNGRSASQAKRETRRRGENTTYGGDAVLVVDVRDVQAENMLVVRVLFPRTGSDLGQMGTCRGQRALYERGWDGSDISFNVSR